MTNTELVKLLKGTEADKRQLKEYLTDQIANGIALSIAEMSAFLVLQGDQ